MSEWISELGVSTFFGPRLEVRGEEYRGRQFLAVVRE